ncbi:MAG: hypothetical protein R2764_02195 [Bacteroidales bacterium]
MFIKVLTIIFYIQSVMIAGCHSAQNKEASGDQLPVIIYNGETQDLSDEKTIELSEKLDFIATGCDDFYELIVTSKLIEELKNKEKYIEIVYPQPQSMSFGKFSEYELSRIFIPLSGKYASSGQVTFFYGTADYSNTPFSNSKGLDTLVPFLISIVH